jgi:hypothetical protein
MGTARNRRKKYLAFPVMTGGNPNDGTGSAQTFRIECGQDMLDSTNDWTPFMRSTGLDVGGPLFSIKGEYSGTEPKIYDFSNGIVRYRGPIFATWSNMAWPTSWWVPPHSSAPTLLGLGTTAISRCAPTNPHAQIGTALGELYRDGLPKASSSLLRRRTPEGLAEDYLNYEFGWKPFVSDLKQFASAVRKSDRLLKQYHRDANRNVRRSYHFPDVINSSTYTYTGSDVWSTLNNPWLVVSGAKKNFYTYRKQQWFKGAFSYPAPPQSTMSAFAKAKEYADHILGLELNPQVIYDLTPWSWAVDWFTNCGDMLNNLSMMAEDGLVLKYGYMMEKAEESDEYQFTGSFHYPDQTIGLYQKIHRTVMQRVPATPFGFGLNPDSFTDRQIAIMAALGMTRGGKYAAK